MASTNTQIVLRERPSNHINPSLDPPGTYSLQRSPLPDQLEEGQILVQNEFYSLDPAMRGWLNDKRSYVPPVQIGETMRSHAAGKVLKSKHAKIQEGDYVSGTFGWQEYTVINGDQARPIPPGTQPIDTVGIFGLTGLTAYFGITRILQSKAGQVVVVTGAAGGVGTAVIQILKIIGCKVVAVAGSDEKCRFLREEFQADETLNYKAADYKKAFIDVVTKLGYADSVFENVGGPQLDLVLPLMKPHGRICLCGNISQYNKTEADGIKNLTSVTRMRLTVSGFIIFDYESEYEEGIQALTAWIKEGKLKPRYHIVEGGVTKAPQALLDLFAGKNVGKMLLKA